jgi:hypothetical protein
MKTSGDETSIAAGTQDEEPLPLADHKANGLSNPVVSVLQHEGISIVKDQLDFSARGELFLRMNALRIVMLQRPKTLYKLPQAGVRKELPVMHVDRAAGRSGIGRDYRPSTAQS